MKGYRIVNLHDLLSEIGEERANTILSDFECPLNEDVERFLKYSAIEFVKQQIAVTHLVFASYQEQPVLVGYYTLANKFITISSRAKLSKRLMKRVNKFCTYNTLLGRYELSAPLIAQLGKNFYNDYNHLITGDELLNMACDRIASIQLQLGGKIAYLECEPSQKLIDFYTRNGFVPFDNRSLDSDDRALHKSDYLVQMLKYLGSVEVLK